MEPNQSPFKPEKLDLMNNLKGWNIYYFLLFFIIIPLINILIYCLSTEVKTFFFIFHTSELLQLQTFLLSSYTHLEFYPHLISNLIFYYIVITVIFSFEKNKERFHQISILALIFVPIIISLYTAAFFLIVGKNAASLGFSGIDATFFAYAYIIGFTGVIGNSLETLDHPELFTDRKWRFYLLCILATIVIALISYSGVVLGQFLPSGDTISNGLAHFTGFIIGLIAFLIFDIFNEKRKYFDLMLGFSIVLGIITYLNYLEKII